MVQKYTSLYKDDPIAAELEAGIQGTDVYQGSPYVLANVPGFEGVRYATPDYNRYQDLYGLYMGGGFDAAQDDFPIQAGDITGGQIIDTGAGDASSIGTIPLDQTGVTGVNTPFEQNLIDQGAGVQIAPGQPVVAPGEMPVTQAEMDEFNRIPVSTDYVDPYTSLGEEEGRLTYAEQLQQLQDEQALTNLERARTGQSNVPTYIGGERTLEDTGAGIDDMYATDYSGEPYDDLMDYDEHYDMVEPTSQKNILANKQLALENRGLDDVTFDELDSHYNQNLETAPEYSVTRPAGIDASMTAPQTTDFPDQVDFDQGFIDAGDFSAPGTLADPAEKQDIESLPAQEQNNLLSDIANQLGGIWDNTSKTIEIAGQKINPFVAGVKGAINKYIFGGFPATLIFDALGAMGIEPGYSDQTKAAQYIGLAKEGETQDIYGINTQSMFGDYDQYNIDRVEELEDIVADQLSRGKTNTIQMRELEDRKSYNRMASGDIDDDPTGDAQIAEEIALQDRIDAGIEAADEEPGPSGDRPQGVDAGTADIQDYADIYEPPAPVATVTYSQPSHHGNGGGNGRGGSQQATSGGGFSSGWGGGWGWSKGGIVSLKNAKR